MRDSEAETYYEVEIMLGNIDESHIIRTIEYWGISKDSGDLSSTIKPCG
jgi:hypothetical protein